METLDLGALDLGLIVCYLLAVGLLGLWFSRGVKTGKDFFLAGRSLPWWAAGLSLVVSDIGAKDMIGLAGDGYRFGVVMMNFDDDDEQTKHQNLPLRNTADDDWRD